MKEFKLIIIILLFYAMQSFAGICTSIGSGNWESASSWSCGNVPVCGDSILIIAGDTVTITIQQDYFTACSKPMYITVNGTLIMQTGKKLMLPAGSWVETNVGGLLTPSGGGGGSSNLIDIGGINWWKAGDGIVSGYELFGVKSPLPIQLLGFEANPLGDKIEIKWTTASETNNDFFTIEKTKDGMQYEIVTTVDGVGNSTSMKKYSAVDTYPYEGHSYYRLKQTDFNGSNSQSNLVAVDFIKNTNFSLKVYPNPSTGVCINLDLFTEKGDETILVITDAFGKQIYSEVIRINENEENIYSFCSPEKLPSGIYFIKVTSMQKEYVKKFIME